MLSSPGISPTFDISCRHTPREDEDYLSPAPCTSASRPAYFSVLDSIVRFLIFLFEKDVSLTRAALFIEQQISGRLCASQLTAARTEAKKVNGISDGTSQSFPIYSG